jgi:hypothetical protein
MRIASGVVTTLFLTGIAWSAPALAQGVPQGTYSRSCTNVSVQGDSLVATCRGAGGREQRSTLAGFRRCVGDIGNNNGTLQCAFAGGAPPQGQMPSSGAQPQGGQMPTGAQPYGQAPQPQPGSVPPR